MIKFTIFGEPVAAQRPRFTVKKGFAIAYTAKKMKIGLADFRTQALQFKPEFPLEGPLAIKIRVYRSIPTSFSKKKSLDAQNGVLRPFRRPDGSNYLKLVEDSLCDLYYKDDAQLVDIQISKFYAKNPRTEVEIKEVENV